ncbi:MAG: spore coat protein [Roseburia sp.]|nr:spore coat protein [Roseburia sp.]
MSELKDYDSLYDIARDYSDTEQSNYETETADEFADTPIEFQTETSNEFSDTDVEREADISDNSAEFATEFDGVSDNSAEFATEHNVSREFGLPGTVPASSNGYDASYGSADDAETGSDCDCGYEVTEDLADSDMSSDDETAATCDDLYTTTRAQAECALDDYEIISDVLGAEKQLVKLYSTALCEASEENFRNVLRDNLTECAADQYSTFEFMEKRGMYPTSEASEEDVLKAKQQFSPLCDCHDCKI